MPADFPDFSSAIIPGEFVLTGQGTKLVAVTGTAIALRAATTVKIVMLKARVTNTATLYLGASTVTADEAPTTGGLQLGAGDMLTFTETDLAHIFLNGTAGDGVSYCYWT